MTAFSRTKARMCSGCHVRSGNMHAKTGLIKTCVSPPIQPAASSTDCVIGPTLGVLTSSAMKFCSRAHVGWVKVNASGAAGDRSRRTPCGSKPTWAELLVDCREKRKGVVGLFFQSQLLTGDATNGAAVICRIRRATKWVEENEGERDKKRMRQQVRKSQAEKKSRWSK